MLESNSYLRPIPEDKSDTASRRSFSDHRGGADHSTFRLPSLNNVPRVTGPSSEAGSSVRAMQAGHEGSIMSGSSVNGIVPMQSVPEASLHVHEKKKRPWCLRTSVLVTVAILTLIFLAVLLILVLDVGKNNNPVAASASGGVDSNETSAPTVSPATIELLDNMLLTITSEADLANPATPQNKARNWMLFTDLLRDDVLMDGIEHVIQRYALASLYFSTGGGFLWIETLGGIRQDEFECDWPGITCDASSNTVSIVNYTETGLTGRLPSEVGQLSTLQELDLSKNHLSGPIPEDWFGDNSKMLNLFYLDLSENNATGSIPERIWECPVLRFVYLHSNQLTGSVQRRESAAASLSPYLETIWLDENKLNGTLPSWFNEMTALESLFVYDNSFTGPLPDFTGMNQLMFLDVSLNNLTGELPPTLLYELPGIRKLFLDYNQFSGAIPAPAGNAVVQSVQLRKLWLQGNGFSGQLPVNFGQDWSLLTEVLLFENPDLSGTITNCAVNWPSADRIEADCDSSVFSPPVTCDCCTQCHG